LSFEVVVLSLAEFYPLSGMENLEPYRIVRRTTERKIDIHDCCVIIKNTTTKQQH
jgi:hypothetical protein